MTEVVDRIDCRSDILTGTTEITGEVTRQLRRYCEAGAAERHDHNRAVPRTTESDLPSGSAADDLWISRRYGLNSEDQALRIVAVATKDDEQSSVRLG